MVCLVFAIIFWLLSLLYLPFALFALALGGGMGGTGCQLEGWSMIKTSLLLCAVGFIFYLN